MTTHNKIDLLMGVLKMHRPGYEYDTQISGNTRGYRLHTETGRDIGQRLPAGEFHVFLDGYVQGILDTVWTAQMGAGA